MMVLRSSRTRADPVAGSASLMRSTPWFSTCGRRFPGARRVHRRGVAVAVDAAAADVDRVDVPGVEIEQQVAEPGLGCQGRLLEVLQNDEIRRCAGVEAAEGLAEGFPGQAVVAQPEPGGAAAAHRPAAAFVAPEVGGAQLAPHVVVEAVGADPTVHRETVHRGPAHAVVHVGAAAVDQPDALGLEGLHVQGRQVHPVSENAARPDQTEIDQPVQGVLPAAVLTHLAVGGALGQVDVQAHAHSGCRYLPAGPACVPRG